MTIFFKSFVFQVHKIEKPSPAHVFRGFESSDNGVTYKPVFKLHNEPDPVSTSKEVIPPSDTVKKNLFKFHDKGTELEDTEEILPVLPPSSKTEDTPADLPGSGVGPEEVIVDSVNLDSGNSQSGTQVFVPEAEKDKCSNAFEEVEDEMCSSFERRLAESITQSTWAHDLEDDSDGKRG